MDHVFLSRFNKDIKAIEPNLDEVEIMKSFSVDELKNMIKNNPNQFTPWFVNIFTNRHEYLLNSLETIEKKGFNKQQFESEIKIRNCYH